MISIITPTRNRPHQLRKLLASILKHNTYPDFEVVIIDDNSGQESRTLLEGVFAERMLSALKLVYLHNDERKFPAYCRNEGVKRAKGDIVYFVDDDCEFRADNLLEISKFYGTEANTNTILGGYNICSGENFYAGLYNSFSNCSLFLFWNQERGFCRKMIRGEKADNFLVCFSPSLNMACPRAAFAELHFNEQYAVNEDEVFCKEAIENGYKILFTRKIKLSHNHLFISFYEMLVRLTELGERSRKENASRRLVFAFFYPFVLALFTRKLQFIFHYSLMSFAWAAPFLLRRKQGSFS